MDSTVKLVLPTSTFLSITYRKLDFSLSHPPLPATALLDSIPFLEVRRSSSLLDHLSTSMLRLSKHGG